MNENSVMQCNECKVQLLTADIQEGFLACSYRPVSNVLHSHSHTFLTEVVGRISFNINKIQLERSSSQFSSNW